MMLISFSTHKSSWTAVFASIAVFACLLAVTSKYSMAQALTSMQNPREDIAIIFLADRTNPVNGASQWLNGGSIELGVDAWHGFGIAANVSGATTSSLGSQNVPLSLIVTTFGPRYRIRHSLHSGREISIYGEGLVGEANGFRSLFATPTGVTASSNAFASQVGGGLDFNLTPRFGIRAVEANWMRTQFPNGGTNAQNHLQLGAGMFLRF